MATTKTFAGFPAGTLKFLRGLRQNNSKEWFESHRSEYDAFYVDAGKAFVEAVGVKLAKIAPRIVVEPRINGSVFRINRDVRFSKDKRPYKDHLDISLWEGDKKGSPSALFFRVSPDGVYIGAGHHACKQLLKPFRAAVTDPLAGRELAGVAKKLRKSGYQLEGSAYKRMPTGFAEDGPAAEFLLHDGLYVVTEKPAAFAEDKGLVNECIRNWKAAMPLHNWLIDHVRG